MKTRTLKRKQKLSRRRGKLSKKTLRRRTKYKRNKKKKGGFVRDGSIQNFITDISKCIKW